MKIEYTTTEKMKQDLIDFLSKKDVEIETYMIKPDIQRLDLSTNTGINIKYDYTGIVNIEITIRKQRFEIEDEITKHR